MYVSKTWIGSNVEEELMGEAGREVRRQVPQSREDRLKDWPRAVVAEEQRDLKDTVEVEIAECYDGLDGWREKWSMTSGSTVCMFGN